MQTITQSPVEGGNMPKLFFHKDQWRGTIPNGLNLLDVLYTTRQGDQGPRLTYRSRSYSLDPQRKWAERRVASGILVGLGLPVGLDAEGYVWPVGASDIPALENFAGFTDKMIAGDRIIVFASGGIALRIPGVQEGDRHKAVYAHGPDDFRLTQEPGGLRIGTVEQIENIAGQADMALVLFHAANEPARTPRFNRR